LRPPPGVRWPRGGPKRPTAAPILARLLRRVGTRASQREWDARVLSAPI